MSADAEQGGRAFWVAFGAGSLVMVWGLWLLVQTTSRGGERVGFAFWIVLADVLVDWLAVPVIGALGWMAVRLTPGWLRAPVQVGLILTGTVLLVGWLPLQGTAAGTGNPTIQPLDYPTLVTATLAAVWSTMAVWSACRWWRVRG